MPGRRSRTYFPKGELIDLLSNEEAEEAEYTRRKGQGGERSEESAKLPVLDHPTANSDCQLYGCHSTANHAYRLYLAIRNNGGFSSTIPTIITTLAAAQALQSDEQAIAGLELLTADDEETINYLGGVGSTCYAKQRC